ncbi:site-specific integrase [Paenibacillus athensensis]|nr:tyrosine-type recombinase/integrase [Paenibacillus athensensis]MCD1259749.1 site-specific integrase [Paenibacillus athensensis]
MPVYKDEKVKTNPWYYSFEVKSPDGKRRTEKKRGFRTKREAEKAEISVKDAINKGTYVQPSKLSLGEYLVRWLDTRIDLKKSTKIGYDSIIRNHIMPDKISQISLSEINAMTVEGFMTKVHASKYSDSFKRNIFKMIHKALKDAERKQLILRNPAALVTKPKVAKKEMKYWTAEEAKTFLKAIQPHRLRIIFMLAIHCGMRMGEIRGLRLSDIDLERGIISVRHIMDSERNLQIGTKTNAGNRAISLSPFVIREIEQRIAGIAVEKNTAGDEYEDLGYLVCTKKGRPYLKKNFRDIWIRLLNKTGLKPIRFHDLRHTCASLLLGLGIHPKIVQERLGHSSVQITLDTYSHLAPNMQQDAANALQDLLE